MDPKVIVMSVKEVAMDLQVLTSNAPLCPWEWPDGGIFEALIKENFVGSDNS